MTKGWGRRIATNSTPAYNTETFKKCHEGVVHDRPYNSRPSREIYLITGLLEYQIWKSKLSITSLELYSPTTLQMSVGSTVADRCFEGMFFGFREDIKRIGLLYFKAISILNRQWNPIHSWRTIKHGSTDHGSLRP